MIRIATRKSRLALWQAEYVKRLLLANDPGLHIQLLPLLTQGDKITDTRLLKAGGKGLFVKELERALLTEQADLAVHSMKDMSADLTDGLILSAVCQRARPHDAFVANNYHHFSALPPAAKVGTSSLRRQCQLMSLRPDITIRTLRGNIDTRLAKLDSGEYDAIVLAAAGLQRLGLSSRIRHCFDLTHILPAAGQGALGIECRVGDQNILDLVAPLNHIGSAACVHAERNISAVLGGNCQTPVAAYATLGDNQMTVRGLVGSPDGRKVVRSVATGSLEQAQDLGIQAGRQLLQQGAVQILQDCLDTDEQ